MSYQASDDGIRCWPVIGIGKVLLERLASICQICGKIGERTQYDISFLRFFLNQINAVKLSVDELELRKLLCNLCTFVAVADEAGEFILGMGIGDGVNGIAANVSCSSGCEDYRHCRSLLFRSILCAMEKSLGKFIIIDFDVLPSFDRGRDV